METTRKFDPESLNRYLAESKQQMREEFEERYQNDAAFRAMIEQLQESSRMQHEQNALDSSEHQLE